MSRYLVSRLCQLDLVPILIDSSQWHSMTVEDLGSLWKTIVNSFRHFDSPIGWLDGHEDAFLRTTLKAQLFRIVFDGFDEYVLRNGGRPLEVLDALVDLAESTGARILITSRSSFWRTSIPDDAAKDVIKKTGTLVYEILPFDHQHARNYFKERLKSDAKTEAAVRLHAAVREDNEDLAGRGFVLSLIADLVDRSDNRPSIERQHGRALLWLMQALCERETLRQQLPLTGDDQISLMSSFGIRSVNRVADTPSTPAYIGCHRWDARPERRGRGGFGAGRGVA